MSDAAKQRVAACTHPSVKDGVRKVFEAIAHFVPEGQTTTPIMKMDDLAVEAHVHRITVWRKVGDLVDLGEVEVLDRAPGRQARYRIVHLDGPPPIADVPLPLRADLRSVPKPRRPSPTEPPIPGLLDDPAGEGEDPAINLLHEPVAAVATRRPHLLQLLQRPVAAVARWWVNLLHLLHVNLLHLLQRRKFSDQPVARKPVAPVAGQGVDVDPRARDVHTFKEVHTHAATAAEPAEPSHPPPRRVVHAWHAWCDGRVHVPKGLHADFLRWHGRRPGETDETVTAELVAFYARTCAELPSGQRTGNEFTFWNRAYAKAFTPVAEARAGPVAVGWRPSSQAPRDGVTGSNCPHEPRCARTPDCVARTIAEARGERREQSG